MKEKILLKTYLMSKVSCMVNSFVNSVQLWILCFAQALLTLTEKMLGCLQYLCMNCMRFTDLKVTTLLCFSYNLKIKNL